ncbi:uncharacterized protein PF11_0213-like [Frieseomelitta varia]|nr:uncharacterized protein PF11_0213-like [Frieseomelitta varia]XP_043519103.1 uncharacterized protein PF11_0213-like [Frieseomelitta varia]XP_043519112.1 uncharacterized protein PF11_0213-like [Frieseomelitta varia]XP_043519123.1 uncharacterized protein PF11_0213-like [Frieseomelitta varia]XP_043519131.1 uncharacterized protein PF11_0213-like [Frieseomelitta varia]
MKSGEIRWNIIPNTVADRMIDSSLTHKLVPSKKLSRRNKAMNVMIKQLQNLKSYRQYVEIKTSILRCLTDNSETEDNASFSEDDNSLANYTQLMSEKRNNYFLKESKISENDNISPRRKSTQKFKRTSFITLGWQRVVKSENTSLTRKSNANNFIYDNDNINETSSATNNVKKNTQNKMNTLTKINCTKQKENQLPIKNETNVATVVQKVTNNNDESEQSNSLWINDINEELQSDENHCYKTLNSSDIKTLKDLPASLDNLNEIQNINDENMPFDQNCSNQMKQNSNITETIMNETLIISNTYQPKDSGIDEDTEEECLENGKTHKISNNEIEDKEQDTSSTISVLNNLRNSDNDLKSETYNMSGKKKYFQDTIENINAKEKMQAKKPQSIITHTEIVNRKYKIIPSISVFTENTKPEELSINNSCDEKVEIEETKQIQDDIFHSTEIQLSQFGRLNLTVDSDSSTVDSDSTFENMIDKLYKRSARDSSPDIKQSFATNKFAQDKLDLNYATSCVFDKKKNIKESNEKNLEIGSMIQPVDKKSTCGRPYNLQEFVKKENLMPKTTEPSFTLKDIEEEEEQAFITIPRSILENKLVGNKIVLTENTLKLGKEKYKIKHKNKDNMSSIFGRKDSKIPYKIVNIKPIASVVTQGKITKTNEIKDDVIPKKRHLQLEQNFKKKIKKKHLNIDE